MSILRLNRKRRLQLLFLILFWISGCFFMPAEAFAKQPQDGLLRLSRAEDFARGTFKNTVLRGGGVVLADGCSSGVYVTPALSFPFAFRELIPSWIVETPGGGAFQVYIRVAAEEGKWSSWLHMGAWREKSRDKLLKNELAVVETDYIRALRALRFFQLRIVLTAQGASPAVRSFSFAAAEDGSGRLPSGLFPSAGGRELEVPYRSQGWEDDSIAGHICSPTSVSMVLQYWGKDVLTGDLARSAYDPEYDMYGMWWRAVQAAGQYGLDGWVQYFREWPQVEAWIEKGVPVVACICFEPGELTGSMTDSSEGHVIVLRGYDGDGNILCNDPAGREEKEGVVRYDAAELARAWFLNGGGVGYVILPFEGRELP